MAVAFPRRLIGGPGKVAFLQHAIFQHQRVHVGAAEAIDGVLRRAHDRLAADIEAGVHEHRTTGQVVKSDEQAMEYGVPFRIHRLHAGTEIHVRDRRYRRSRHAQAPAQVAVFGHRPRLFAR